MSIEKETPRAEKPASGKPLSFINIPFGTLIRGARIYRGLKLVDLENQGVITRGFLSQIENGKRIPTRKSKTIVNLANALGVPLEGLIASALFTQLHRDYQNIKGEEISYREFSVIITNLLPRN